MLVKELIAKRTAYLEKDKYVKTFKELLYKAIETSSTSTIEIPFRDIFGYDNIDYTNSAVTEYMELNSILWSWDDNCCGYDCGYFIIDILKLK